MRIWRNWQTRTVQVRVGAIRWRFESSYPHQLKQNTVGVLLFLGLLFISTTIYSHMDYY